VRRSPPRIHEPVLYTRGELFQAALESIVPAGIVETELLRSDGEEAGHLLGVIARQLRLIADSLSRRDKKLTRVKALVEMSDVLNACRQAMDDEVARAPSLGSVRLLEDAGRVERLVLDNWPSGGEWKSSSESLLRALECAVDAGGGDPAAIAKLVGETLKSPAPIIAQFRGFPLVLTRGECVDRVAAMLRAKALLKRKLATDNGIPGTAREIAVWALTAVGTTTDDANNIKAAEKQRAYRQRKRISSAGKNK